MSDGGHSISTLGRPNLVNAILSYLHERDSGSAEAAVSLKELSLYMKMPEHDIAQICTIMRRTHLLAVKVMPDNDHKYWLTEAGKARANRTVRG